MVDRNVSITQSVTKSASITQSVSRAVSTDETVDNPLFFESLVYYHEPVLLTGYSGGQGVNPATDFSGEGNDATQATSGAQALFQTDATGDHIAFGGDDFYNMVVTDSDPAGITLLVVDRRTDDSNFRNYFCHRNDSGGPFIIFGYDNANGTRFISEDSAANRADFDDLTPTTSLSAFGFVQTSGRQEIWTNADASAPADSRSVTQGGNFTSDERLFGARYRGDGTKTDTFLTSDVYTYALYDAALSTSQMQDAIGFLKSKYSI